MREARSAASWTAYTATAGLGYARDAPRRTPPARADDDSGTAAKSSTPTQGGEVNSQRVVPRNFEESRPGSKPSRDFLVLGGGQSRKVRCDFDRWTAHGLIEKVRAAHAGIHQVDIGLEGEARISMTHPSLNLLHVPARLKKQAGAGVAERVEGNSRPRFLLALDLYFHLEPGPDGSGSQGAPVDVFGS